MSENNQKEHLQALVDEALQKISEHVDAVQIFASARAEDGGTGTVFHAEGRGNYYAIRGQVQEWIERQNRRVWNATDAEDRGE